MLLGFKSWRSPPNQTARLTPLPEAQAAWNPAAAWAHAQGHVFRLVPEQGFVVDGQLRTVNPEADAAPRPAVPWRLEWGPSNRHYIVTQELRLRCELGLDPELQLLLINRCLKDQMERSVFERYVEGVQTRIDHDTPPEMRWLVMLPQVPPAELPELGANWVAVGSSKTALLQWVGGALAGALARGVDDPAQPVVLMISRGRLALRTELREHEFGALQDWTGLFETALRAALQVDGQASFRPTRAKPS
jgi:hypothetical protein